MASFVRLVLAEIVKLYYKTSVKIMAALLVLGVCALALMPANEPSGDWVQRLNKQNEGYQEIIEASSGISPRVEGYYRQQIELNEYRINEQLPPVTAEKFMNTIMNLNLLVELFVVIIAAGLIGSEYSSGTIKLLLIRPRSRLSIIMSKWITAIVSYSALIAIVFIGAFATAAIKYGIHDTFADRLVFHGDGIRFESAVWYNAKQLLMISVQPTIIITIAFMLATVMRGAAIATGVSLFISFTSTIITDQLSRFNWVKYTLFANTNLDQYETGQVYSPDMTLGFSIAVLCIYMAVFMFVTLTAFIKRDVSV